MIISRYSLRCELSEGFSRRIEKLRREDGIDIREALCPSLASSDQNLTIALARFMSGSRSTAAGAPTWSMEMRCAMLRPGALS